MEYYYLLRKFVRYKSGFPRAKRSQAKRKAKLAREPVELYKEYLINYRPVPRVWDPYSYLVFSTSFAYHLNF